MKVFAYFVEPASYTLDLISKVHNRLNITIAFINKRTEAKTDLNKNNFIFLSNKSLFSKIRFIYSVWRNQDLIIVNGYNNYVFILTFLFNLLSIKKRYLATESDTQLRIPMNCLKRICKSIYLNLIFRSKHLIGFAGGSKSHQELFRYYGMSEERIFLMPMMVNNDKFFQEKKQSQEIFTFLYVGRLVKHKNVDGLINEFKYHFSDKKAILRIVGGGEEEIYLNKKYSSDKIFFIGNRYNNDLINEYKTATCFCCPSDFEPWGLVVNEALSAGLPVIVTKEVGAKDDLVIGKETGLVADSINDFGSKMLQLYRDPDLLAQYSKNASDLMQNYWNYGLYKSCLVSVIKKIKEWQLVH
jgi:glycosyltransferase involved in cell wall biosynthesis|tara:strand:- start:6941 stop:8008 length:1068 start_codon:yes stop_codon:yes gene_type:complete